MHDKVYGQFHCNLAPLQTELIELQSEYLSNLFICDLVFWKQCKYVQLKNQLQKFTLVFLLHILAKLHSLRWKQLNQNIAACFQISSGGRGRGNGPPPPRNPKEFATYGEQSTRQPAMRINSKKIVKFLLNFSNFYKSFLKNLQNFLKNF